jgi:2,4-dienoyl-CoA reductase-like NADH-dependent reductase (Old Yellow Enzyme family)
MSEFHEIWKPLTIGQTTVKNRIMMSPHRQSYAEDNMPSDRLIAYWVERARGGAALLSGESTSVSRRLARASQEGGPNGWRMTAFEKRVIPRFAELADAVHEHDCKMFMELSYFGVNQGARVDIDDWYPIRGASRVPSPVGTEIPMPMDQTFIDELVADYGQSAANMKSAGLDGVEVHAAHGYMPMQFLSPAFNKRTDRYGGSTKGRAQLLVEIGESIRKQVGSEFTVGMRLSFDEYIGEAGVTPELAEEYLEIFAASGYFDFFSISSGSYHSFHYAVPPMGSVGDAFLTSYGQRAKRIVGDRAKIFLAGRILDLHTAERVVAQGAADMVAMVRAQIADPFLVKKTLEGRAEEVTRCTGANECLATGFSGREMHCVMNPAVGRERRWGEGTLRSTNKIKRVVVVGAGPAGLKIAGVLGQRGHDVVLLERELQIGGRINLIKRLPTRGDWQAVIDNLSAILSKSRIEPHFGVEATVGLLEDEEPDEIICATGATWDRTGFSACRPDRETVPGFDQANVLDIGTAVAAAIEDPKSLGRKVLIVDDTGGYFPIGLAEVLGNAGITVEVVSRFDAVGGDLSATLDRPFVLSRLAELNVRLTSGHFIESIQGSVVEIYETWSKRTRLVEDIDTVVLAMLRSPDDELYHELVGSTDIGVHRIGDALNPRGVADAIYEGELIGREI